MFAFIWDRLGMIPNFFIELFNTLWTSTMMYVVIQMLTDFKTYRFDNQF